MLWSSIPDDDLSKLPNSFVIFKHSPRCPISIAAKMRWNLLWESNSSIPVYLIDVINDRLLSNKVADYFQIEHQSPQIIAVCKNKVVLTQSHSQINPNDSALILADCY
jgi:bacillithiol system protein YtxJ